MDEVAPGIWVATADTYTTTTTVVAGAGGSCLVADPAVSPADLDALSSWLSSRGLRPAVGWSTHPHWDHVLWSRGLGADVVRYATPRASLTAERELPGLTEGVQKSAPGHDLALFGRLAPLAAAEVPWDGPRAVVIAHDAHAPGHGALFLPDSGVLVAGDMCSDIEIPLPDMDASDAPEAAETSEAAESPEGADPFGAYRHGLGLLASQAGVRVVVPGHGHVGDAAEFGRRIANDFAYLDAVEAGRDPRDPRLALEWLRAEHERHRAHVHDGG